MIHSLGHPVLIALRLLLESVENFRPSHHHLHSKEALGRSHMRDHWIARHDHEGRTGLRLGHSDDDHVGLYRGDFQGEARLRLWVMIAS